MSSSEGRQRAKPKAFGLLLSIGCLYLSFGVSFGMLQAGLPPILRAQGIEIGALGWLAAILLPFGLTFLWAPLLDRFGSGLRAPKICWIVAMQTVTAILLTALGHADPTSMRAVFSLSLAIAFAAATMDIALDALTSQAVDPADRPIAGGIKVASLATGSIFGGGLFVAYFQHVGWMTIFGIMAVLTMLSTIPILSQTHRDTAKNGNSQDAVKASLAKAFRGTERRRHLITLAVITVPVVLLFGLNRVMLVDIGLSLEQIGTIVGTASPIGSLLATGLSVVLVRRYGAIRSIIVFTVFCLLAVAMIITGMALRDQTALVVIGAIAATAGSSGIYVATCSMILGWANSDQPATDYAALYGISRFFGLILLMLMAQAVSFIGWIAFFAIACVALVLGVTAANRMMSKTDA